MEHVFKTDPDVFDAVAAGMKPWDMRNLSGRNVKVGDTIRQRKTKHSGQQMKDNPSQFPLEYTGDELKGTVKYILFGPVYGMEAGWAVMTVDYGAGNMSENTTKEGIEVMPGQVWQDLDKRMNGRHVRVISVISGKATVARTNPVNGWTCERKTVLSVQRMHKGNTGWELVSAGA